jgi:hypothetical protein
MTAMAIRRTFVAGVGFALIRTILLRCFCFAGATLVSAFHALTSGTG